MSQQLLERTDSFSHRAVDVAEVLQKQRRFNRIIDQLVGSGTSVGANATEANEAVSTKDFCKSLGTMLKELGETGYWLRFASKRNWIPLKRLAPLIQESQELKKIFGSMLARIRKREK